MHLQRLTSLAATTAAAGGLAWMLKVAVIAAADGANDDEGAAAVLFVAGLALMLAGSTCVGARLARGRGRPVAALLLLLSPVLFLLSFVVLDGLVGGAIGEAGPTWLGDESGIAATGAAWLAIGLAVRRAGPVRVSAMSPV